jgi:hypothetical protein
MMEEQERAEVQRELNKNKVYEPFRFFLQVGETREIVIVDDAPDWFRTEHQMKDKRTGRWSLYVPCIEEHTNCPACEVSERPAYFALYLTIIDLTPYTNRDGDEMEWSKKLLVVKPAQQKKIVRHFEKHGTLRGLRLEMTRDGEMDANIGNDIQVIGFMEEDELLEFERTYKDKEGKTHTEAGHEPYDYDAIYPAMTEAQIRALVGGSPAVGSRAADDASVGRTRRAPRRDDDDADVAPNPRRRAARDADGDDEAPPRRRASRENDDDDTPPQRRRASREDASDDDDAPPARRRTAAPVDDTDDDAPAPRRRAAVRDADVPQRRSRPAVEDDDTQPFDAEGDDDVAEEAPRRTTATRRAARRGG